MATVLTQKRNLHTDSHTGRRSQAKNLPEAGREKRKDPSPAPSEGARPADSGSYETINTCHPKLPVCSTLLPQPEQTNTDYKRLMCTNQPTRFTMHLRSSFPPHGHWPPQRSRPHPLTLAPPPPASTAKLTCTLPSHYPLKDAYFSASLWLKYLQWLPNSYRKKPRFSRFSWLALRPLSSRLAPTTKWPWTMQPLFLMPCFLPFVTLPFNNPNLDHPMNTTAKTHFHWEALHTQADSKDHISDLCVFTACMSHSALARDSLVWLPSMLKVHTWIPQLDYKLLRDRVPVL